MNRGAPLPLHAHSIMPEANGSTTCSTGKSEQDIHYEQFAEAISCTHLDDFYRVVLDSIPSAVLIVEKDVILVDYNASAGSLITQHRDVALAQRAGHAIQCVHSLDVPAGCGRGPSCGQCRIRNAVDHALSGTAVPRQKIDLELFDVDKIRKVSFWLTATPVTYDQHKYALLLLDHADSSP